VKEIDLTTYDVGPGTLVDYAYVDEALALGMRWHLQVEWPCERSGLGEPPGEVLWSMRHERADQAAVRLEGALAVLSLRHGFLNVTVGAETRAAATAALGELRERYPAPQPSVEEQRVPVSFWALGPQGPQCFRRKIDVPTWEQIRENYSEAHHVRSGLDELMMRFRPALGGQLLIWSGPPGTGKTFALRALAWAWRKFCDLHYVTDPEVFFGKEPAYLLQVLLQGGDGEDPTPKEGQSTAPRWMLLVLEDTGEMLAPDAKKDVGQGLSRLLNVVDGLIGQGLRVLVLITTNEELTHLHDAVVRPGRCASKIEFQSLTFDETVRWLEARGVEGSRPGEVTLAELYAELEGRASAQGRTPVGFAAER